MTEPTERTGWRRAVQSTQTPPRPFLLTLALAVDGLILCFAFGAGFPGTLLFAPLFLLVGGLVYWCFEMNPVALRIRGAAAVMALLSALGLVKTADPASAAFVGGWGLLGALGCLAAWAAYRKPDRGARRGGKWEDLLDERPERGELAGSWDVAPPRPFALTVLLLADWAALAVAAVAATTLFADKEGGFALSLTALLALAAVDIMAWQMHRFGLAARSGIAVVLLVLALLAVGPFSPWTLVAALHAAAAGAAAAVAWKALAEDRVDRDPRRVVRAAGRVESAPCEARRSS